MASWVEMRIAGLKRRLLDVRQQRPLRVVQTLYPPELSLPDVEMIFEQDIGSIEDQNLDCDIFLCAGDRDGLESMQKMQMRNRATVFAVWLKQNGTEVSTSMYSALVSDIYFYADPFHHAYLSNYFSIDGGFVSAAAVPWPLRDAEEVARQMLLAPRDVEVSRSGDYRNDLDWTYQDQFAEHEKIPTLDSGPDSLQLWMRAKIVICTSSNEMLVADTINALLSGCIPLLLRKSDYLDLVIPKEMQEYLPIFFLDEISQDYVAHAQAKALLLFEAEGTEGVHRRHVFAKTRHMPSNRLTHMVNSILTIPIADC